ncbi:MAG: ABC transporter permease [Candidatus Gracilibacteria bacterium]
MKKVQQNYWYTVWILAKTDFKLRYNGSILGILWVVLKPLFIFSILNFVFSQLFGGSKEYSLSLLTGLIIWNYFAEGTMVGMVSLLQKAHIITKVNLPKWIVVFASTLNSLLTFLLNTLILVFFFILYGVFPNIFSILTAVFFASLIFIWILAFSFLTSPLFLRFRDLNQIWEVILNAGIYAAPIIYPITTIPEVYRTLLYINPVTLILVKIKDALFHGKEYFSFMDGVLLIASSWLYILLLVLVLVGSLLFFHRASRGAAEYV